MKNVPGLVFVSVVLLHQAYIYSMNSSSLFDKSLPLKLLSTDAQEQRQQEEEPQQDRKVNVPSLVNTSSLFDNLPRDQKLVQMEEHVAANQGTVKENSDAQEEEAIAADGEPETAKKDEMPWNWFWGSLTPEQQKAHPDLSEKQKKALLEQKRIQFQYSTKRIAQIQEVTPTHEIARIIHFIYVSPGLPLEQPDVPDRVIKVLDEWQRINPDYLIVLWRNKDMVEHFPDTLPTLQSVPIAAWVADVLRLFVLAKMGGLYFDTDINPIQTIEPIRRDYGPFFGGCEWTGSDPGLFVRSKSEYLDPKCFLNNNAIGVVPHHAALQEASQTALFNTQDKMKTWTSESKFSRHTAGPEFWHKIAKKHNVNRMRHTLFQPCGWLLKKHCHTEFFLVDPMVKPHVYTIHDFKLSWKHKETDNAHLIPYDPKAAESFYNRTTN